MVSINVPRTVPKQDFDSSLGGIEHGLRLRPNESMFAVGFIPDGHKMGAEFGGELAGAQLRFSLMTKTVAHAKREFPKREIFIHKLSFAMFN